MDQEALTAVLRALRTAAGSQARAGQLIGLGQESFSKLENGVRGSISYATYARILELLGGQAREHGRGPAPVLEFAPLPTDSEVEALRRCIIRGDAATASEDSAWAAVEEDLASAGITDPGVDEVRRRLLEKREAAAMRASDLFDTFTRSVFTDDEEFAWAHYELWLSQELSVIETRAAAVLEGLWHDERYRPLFQEFLDRVGRDRDQLPVQEDLRCWLALYRAVAPLADGDATWGAERAPKEMDQLDELGPYLKVALAREELLLRPNRDVERVKRARVPESRWEWMGRMAAEDDNPSTPDADILAFLEDTEVNDG